MALLHLDSAAASRPAPETLEATTAFLRREAEVGAYVAQDEAAPVVGELRAGLGRLLGFAADEVALVHGAGDGLTRLLHAWRWAPGSRVGLASSGWGPNRMLFQHAGLTPVPLPMTSTGHVDVDGTAAVIATGGVDLVHLDHAAAHRGLHQPAAAVATLCRDAGVPLWLDVAQACGVLPGVPADAVHGTSRKWLAGPRGAGFLAVARRHWPRLRVPTHPDGVAATPVAALEPGELAVASQIGLAVAVARHEASAATVRTRLAEVGERVRTAASDLPGWEVVAAQEGPITALRPTAGQDVTAVRRDLLQRHDILTTASLPWRAPGEMTEAWLRISPHTDLADTDLERLRTALSACR